jgi:hypothetical protein
MNKNVNKGISIAPLKYAKLTDKELERVIRNELKKYPYLIKRHIILTNPKYDVIEKNVHGPKISKKNESRLAIEKELEEMKKPNVFTYHYSDKKIKEKYPEFSFSKQKRDRTPSPDRRKPLHAKLDLVKRRSLSIRILPQH